VFSYITNSSGFGKNWGSSVPSCREYWGNWNGQAVISQFKDSARVRILAGKALTERWSRCLGAICGLHQEHLGAAAQCHFMILKVSFPFFARAPSLSIMSLSAVLPDQEGQLLGDMRAFPLGNSILWMSLRDRVQPSDWFYSSAELCPTNSNFLYRPQSTSPHPPLVTPV
jgi:hypothetical protein